jgi:hypothetical protein
MGTDGIVPVLLQQGVEHVVPHLCRIFRACMAYIFLRLRSSRMLTSFVVTNILKEPVPICSSEAFDINLPKYMASDPNIIILIFNAVRISSLNRAQNLLSRLDYDVFHGFLPP